MHLGFHDLLLLDPFLILDDFRSENPAEYQAGFPWHPHRGMETITYVLDGDVKHHHTVFAYVIDGEAILILLAFPSHTMQRE